MPFLMRSLLILIISLVLTSHSFSFFKFYFRYYTPVKGLPSLKVNKTIQDKTGYIWFGTASGLCKYDGQQFKTYLVKDGLPSNIINTIVNKDNVLWVGTDQGLVKLNLSTNKFEATPIKTKVYSLYIDKEDNLWFSVEGKVAILKNNKLILKFNNLDIPQKTTYAIHQDSKGNVWLGTNDGLYLLNEEKGKITSYTVENDFPAKKIFAISENEGFLWFGTSAGLFRFNGKAFTPFSLGEGLTGTQITSIAINKNKDIWLGYSGGIAKITGDKVKTYSRANGLPHDNISDLIIDREHSLWISTKGGGVAKLSDDKFIHLPIKFRGSNKLIYSIFESEKNDLWFGGEGVIAHLSNTDELIVRSQGSYVGGRYIKDIFLDSDHSLWFISDDVSKMSSDGKKLNSYAREYFFDSNDILSYTPIENVTEENETWLGTTKGIYIIWDTNTENPVSEYHKDFFSQYRITALLIDKTTIDKKKKAKTSIKTDESSKTKKEAIKSIPQKDKPNPNKTEKEAVKETQKEKTQKKEAQVQSDKTKSDIDKTKKKAIAKDQQKELKSQAQPKKKVTEPTKNKKADTKKQKVKIKHGKNLPAKKKSGQSEKKIKPSKKKVKTIKKSKKKKKSVKSKFKKPGQSDELSENEKRILSEIRNQSSLGKDAIESAKEQYKPTAKLKAELWVATRNNGLYKVKKDRSYTLVKGTDKYLKNTGVHKLFQDSKNNLWVLSEKGVFKITPKNKVEHFKAGGKLLENFAWTIHEDKTGNIWIGTNGGGLSRLGANGEVTHYTEKNGLSSNVVYKILSNTKGDLWIVTNQALDKFDGERFVSYNANNGLNGDLLGELTPLFIDSKENIWVGTTNGLTKLDAKKDIKNEIPPKLVLKSVQLNNAILENFIEGKSFSHDENSFIFHFVGLSYKDEEGVKYQYFLEGYDKDRKSQPLTSQPYVQYSNLPDKSYTLFVRAQNQDGVWNEKEFKRSFVINPPFYEEPWFIGLCILVVIAGGFSFHKWSLKKLERQNLALETKVNSRTSELLKEKEVSEKLLLNILPETVAIELKETGHAVPRNYDCITVMFTDFKGFTQIAERLSAQELVRELDRYFAFFDDIVKSHHFEKLKTIGDAYMSAGGIPVVNGTHPIDAILSAAEIQDFMLTMRERNIIEKKPFWELRLGIHTGPAMAGVVGKTKFLYDIWGDSVNMASRMESSGEPNKINISGTTYNLVKDFFACEHRGQIPAKNKGLVDMYFVESLQPHLQYNNRAFDPNDLFWELYDKLKEKGEMKLVS